VWQSGGVLFLALEVSQNAIDDALVLDARDHFGRASTASTDLDVDIEDAFQSGIRPVEWADGANHEGFATLLRADGDPIRHGTTQKMRHGIRVFCGIEFQPGSLGVLLQQALSLQAATDTAEFETNLRRERQMEGIARAQAAGNYRGRKKSVDATKVHQLNKSGLGATEIARELNIGRASVYRALRTAGAL